MSKAAKLIKRANELPNSTEMSEKLKSIKPFVLDNFYGFSVTRPGGKGMSERDFKAIISTLKRSGVTQLSITDLER